MDEVAEGDIRARTDREEEVVGMLDDPAEVAEEDMLLIAGSARRLSPLVTGGEETIRLPRLVGTGDGARRRLIGVGLEAGDGDGIGIINEMLRSFWMGGCYLVTGYAERSRSDLKYIPGVGRYTPENGSQDDKK